MVTLDLIDLYSRFKEWVLAGNAECLLAFATVGGEITEIPLYLFMLNGWLIVPQSANHTLTVTNGILVGQGGADPFTDPVGAYKIRINRQTPGIAIGYSTSGGSGPTAAEIAAELLSSLQSTTIPVNLTQVKGQSLVGVGTELSPWGPA
jgi:hypothetical protein